MERARADHYAVAGQVMPRRKRVPPGTKIKLATATEEELRDAVRFEFDRTVAMAACKELRRDWEAKGVDPFDCLARLVAHNHAVKEGISRLRRKGVETRQQNAAEHEAEIVQQLAEAGGRVKAVAIDRQSAGKAASSDTSIRRAAKKTAPGGSR
jgi:hypothetical protein